MSEEMLSIKPFGLESQRNDDSSFREEFEYGALKKGMGVTIGNAIRRVVLSNTSGYAIRSIFMPSISHQFSTIPGVKEDALDMMTNLKNIIFKGQKECVKGTIFVKGPCIVTAKDISINGLEIVNPESYICSLEDGFSIKLDLNIVRGYGYSLAKDIREKTDPNDVSFRSILLDAFFCPIDFVNFRVVDSGGDSEGLEDLFIEIKTNGSVSPRVAMDNAINYLSEQLSRGLSKSEISDKKSDSLSKKKEVYNPNLFLKVEDLPNIPRRAVNCFKMLGAVLVGDLIFLGKDRLMEEPQFGGNSLNKVNEVLSSLGLNLEMNLPDWPPENKEEMAKKVKDSHVF